MAKILPHGWREVAAAGAAQREIETLARLHDALPDEYTVYHGVHWTRLEGTHAVIDDIDFVVVSPRGAVLIIEQRTGLLREAAPAGAGARDLRPARVVVSLAHSARSLAQRFAKAHGDAPLPVETLFYCPDFTVRDPVSAGVEPSRVVDASRRARLPAIIAEILDEAAVTGVPIARVHRFFRDILELTPEIGVMAEQADTLYTRLSGGLAEWGRRIAFEPFRLHVTGTAGSGKTQLALAAFRDAVAAGRRPLYVCYNRPLADHMNTVVPEGGAVATYHQLCERVSRATGHVPDYGGPDVFAGMERRFAGAPAAALPPVDDLIVDEGQDFWPEWHRALMRLVTPGGRAWWLEDPMQNLYDRPAADLAGWVRLASTTNYRSPRDILAFMRERLAGAGDIEGGSPLSGDALELLVYDGDDELVEATKRAITQAVAAGFRRSMIGVVTFRGREGSAFTGRTQLGPHRLRAFTGRYDLLGEPAYTEGDVLIDSVYRFKGRSAPCVVLTEVDFEQPDERVRRKLFVGMTRATMKLCLVVSRRAAARLAAPVG